MLLKISLFFFIISSCDTFASGQSARESRSAWIVGCNFIPSTAVNQLEMWQAATFDTATIDRELGYAQAIGLNTVRVFLHNLAWRTDPAGFKKRMNTYLVIADGHHIKTIFVFFDDCWNPHPKMGKQPEPIFGVHNSRWVRSPSKYEHDHSADWSFLQCYVRDVIGSFRTDKRILAWDLYNEPGNNEYGLASFPLLRQIFFWAKKTHPSQPLTSGIWTADYPQMNHFVLNHSGILTFHNYEDTVSLKKAMDSLAAYHKPVICTEYMARTYGSTILTHLPVFKRYNVGALNWGLVSGKTNTIYPWSSIGHPFKEEPKVWHHDLLRKDGSPFDPKETELIKSLSEN